MALDLDQFPLYDPLVEIGTNKMSPIWRDFFSTFSQSLNGYLSQYGIFMPPVTTEQRNSINSPRNGQLIYNTTINSAQYYKNGTWTSF